MSEVAPAAAPPHEEPLAPNFERSHTSKLSRIPKSYGRLAAIIGIHSPRGTPESMVAEWESLALICALLTSVGAAGLFITSEFIASFAEKQQEIAASGGNDTSAAFWELQVAEFTMMMFCADTFCFLNATVIATFFVAFVRRHPGHSLAQIWADLGMTYHWPQVYFRIGYVLMVVSLSAFFIMVMSPLKMFGCLAFCCATIIAPLFFAMARSLSIFGTEEHGAITLQTLLTLGLLPGSVAHPHANPVHPSSMPSSIHPEGATTANAPKRLNESAATAPHVC